MLKKIVDDGVVIATMDNPKTNSMNLEMLLAIHETIKEINSDDALKGLVLTGAGKFFSSGFDLPMFLNFKDLDETIAFFDKEEQILLDFFTCDKPVVSAINGHCAAAGMIFSLAADYRIIKNHPKIRVGMSEIKIGLPLSIAQAGVVRYGLDSDLKYRDIMFFGEFMDVNKAKELSVVDEIAEEENLIARAKEVVCTWIDTPNRPFIAIKKLAKLDAAQAMQNKLAEGSWKQSLNCFFQEDVRGTLEFVQATMM